MRRRCQRPVPVPTVLEPPPELPERQSGARAHQARISVPFILSAIVDLMRSLPKPSQLSHATKTSNKFKFGEIGRPRMGRETDEDLRGEKRHRTPNYRQQPDREGDESGDDKRSMFPSEIWRGVVLKYVRTLRRLLDSHPLALSLGRRLDFGKKERTTVERSMEEEAHAEKASGSQPSILNYSEHLGFWEFGRPRIGKRCSQEKESRKQGTPCKNYSCYQSRSWAPGTELH